MSEFRIASRYAKSLIELAEEKSVLEQVHADMQLFSQICRENHAFKLMLKNPIIKHDKKLSILVSLLKGKVNALTLAFFQIITRKNREAFLSLVADEFHHQYNVHKGIVYADITTTFPLSDDLRKDFKQIIKKAFKKDVELHEHVDKKIIGGYMLKIDDRQIDDSISSKLQDLKLKFSNK